jgi:hypothetical protein
MGRKNTLDVLHHSLFGEELQLTDRDAKTLEMYREVFTYWYSNPMRSDSDIARYIRKNFKRSQTQSYRDIAAIKVLLGNVTNASKDWFRFKINSILDEAYDLAKTGKVERANSLVKVALAITKNNRTDQNDGEQYPWEEILPQPFEPTLDPSVIGIKPIPNIKEKAEAMHRKYVQDVEFVELEIADDKEHE